MTDRATPSSDPATPDTPTQPNQPAASTEIKQPFLGPWQAVTVLMVLLALLGALLISISRFTMSADVVAILGVLVTPIVSIGAAAFGVTIAAEKAAEAGAAAGDANAAAATAEKDRTDPREEAGSRGSGEGARSDRANAGHPRACGKFPVGVTPVRAQFCC